MKHFVAAALMVTAAGAAEAQTPAAPAIPNPPPMNMAPGEGPATPPPAPQGGTVLAMLGLDKITGRPTSINAPIGKQVRFATLTITARFCYSTPASETPETAAFVQIEDRRPDQPARKIFSGWMYGSSPGLNAVEHPLYDVWAISCNNNEAKVAATNSTAPVKVQAPDSSDREQVQKLPEGAGQ